MAKWTITHSCGHDATHQIYGPSKDRQRIANAIAQKPCYDCHQAQLQAENAKAAESNAAANLPALTGSEKQIAWAESIRFKIITELDTLGAQAKAQIDSGKASADDPNVIQCLAAMDYIRNQTKASWWIDHRTMSARSLVYAKMKDNI